MTKLAFSIPSFLLLLLSCGICQGSSIKSTSNEIVTAIKKQSRTTKKRRAFLRQAKNQHNLIQKISSQWLDGPYLGRIQGEGREHQQESSTNKKIAKRQMEGFVGLWDDETDDKVEDNTDNNDEINNEEKKKTDSPVASPVKKSLWSSLWGSKVDPTAPPSNPPTYRPSTAPTHGPSAAPTPVPSTAPTHVPIIAPTQVPSTVPTHAPVSSPTHEPSTASTYTEVKQTVPVAAPVKNWKFWGKKSPTAAPVKTEIVWDDQPDDVDNQETVGTKENSPSTPIQTAPVNSPVDWQEQTTHPTSSPVRSAITWDDEAVNFGAGDEEATSGQTTPVNSPTTDVDANEVIKEEDDWLDDTPLFKTDDTGGSKNVTPTFTNATTETNNSMAETENDDTYVKPNEGVYLADDLDDDDTITEETPVYNPSNITEGGNYSPYTGQTPSDGESPIAAPISSPVTKVNEYSYPTASPVSIVISTPPPTPKPTYTKTVSLWDDEEDSPAEETSSEITSLDDDDGSIAGNSGGSNDNDEDLEYIVDDNNFMFSGSTSGEEQKEAPADVKEEEEKVVGWMVGIGLVFMIFTAYQMAENPDGIFASICRLCITIFGFCARMVLFPCRKLCGSGRNYNNIGSTDYREPYRSRRGHFELS